VRLVGARDLGFAAKPAEEGNRVLMRIGPHRFTASRDEAIALAAEIVRAVDHLSLPNGDTHDDT
jgi:hypothetical protein